MNIFNKIKEYNKIIIHRHTRPDYDAFGSQIGLYYAIKETYPEKEVYVVGENKPNVLREMDTINDNVFSDALCIITDVAVAHMVDDKRYSLAKEVIVIDHHKNNCDVTELTIVDTTVSSCCELVTRLLVEGDYKINKSAATALYMGLITDSGRFMYSTTSNTFNAASVLLDSGADFKMIFNTLYRESMEQKKLKAYFALNFHLTEESVAYHFNTKELMETKFKGEDFFTISRGMVNQMAGIETVPIWANFTYDASSGKVVCEFRSAEIEIVDIAKKYGGGGHALACGATIENFEVAKEVLKDFDQLVREQKGV